MSDLELLAMYRHLPVWAQNAACWIDGAKKARLRLGRRFEKLLEELVRSEHWSAGEIEAYQNEKLHALIAHAYETVPLYRERMQSRKLRPDDIRSRADLPKLPILTREEVRLHGKRLVSSRASRRSLLPQNTAGTTGSNLRFCIGKGAVAFQYAVWWRHRLHYGVAPEDWLVNLKGEPVVPPDMLRPPYWRWRSPIREAMVTIHHLTPDKIADVVGFLDAHPFGAYMGRTSVLQALAVTAEDAGLKLGRPPKAVFAGSEALYDYQRRTIEGWANAPVAVHYGLTEACANATQCRERVYHEDFEFGIIEVVDPVVSEDGSRRGDMVCTGFASPEFPFIRYQVGDIAVCHDDPAPCPCGRASARIADVAGRAGDVVVTPEGRRIAQFDVFFSDVRGVKELQVVQEHLGELIIRIVRRPDFTPREEQRIRDAVHRWVSPLLRVEIQDVDQIEREPSGKLRHVKSRLLR